MSDYNEVVTWLITGGAVAVVSWFASWFLEGFAWWGNLKSQVKSLIILLLALGVGMLATWVRSLPAEALAPYVPYLNLLVLTIVAWLGSQVAHRADSKAQ
jgi:hypothetical protein